MPVIAISNQKGGVGKTTTTVNLGAALREAGKRVLLVDLDPQGNLSVAAGLTDVDGLSPTIGDLLMGSARGRATGGPGADDAIVASPAGMDVIPSNGSLSAAELVLVSAMNRESILTNTLKPIADRYDYVLIDCLPSLGLLAINALRAADGVIVPVQADFLAMQGLAQILESVAAVREQLNPSLSIYGVLLTMVDVRTGHSRDVVHTVRSSLAGQVRVFETEVRLQVVLKETAKAGRSILDFDGSSPAAEAYRALASELLAAVGDTTARHSAANEAAGGPPRTEAGPIGAPEGAALGEAGASQEARAPQVATAAVETAAAVAVADAAVPAAAEAPSAAPAAPQPLAFEDFLHGREQWLGSATQ